MTEDQEWELLEHRLNRQKAAQEADNISRANIAAAEFFASQTPELLAITTPRKIFEYAYRIATRDAQGDKDVSTTKRS